MPTPVQRHDDPPIFRSLIEPAQSVLSEENASSPDLFVRAWFESFKKVFGGQS